MLLKFGRGAAASACLGRRGHRLVIHELLCVGADWPQRGHEPAGLLLWRARTVDVTTRRAEVQCSRVGWPALARFGNLHMLLLTASCLATE